MTIQYSRAEIWHLNLDINTQKNIMQKLTVPNQCLKKYLFIVCLCDKQRQTNTSCVIVIYIPNKKGMRKVV